jgi:hypothetical protein
LLGIRYKNLKVEALRIMNARNQKFMIRDSKFMTHELGF